MYEVVCPTCKTLRTVKAKKPWMVGGSPYEKICKVCCQVGKEKSDEHKRKLSESSKNAQTPEMLEQKSKFMLEHPELWKGKLKEGGAEEHCLGKKHTEETKLMIGESVKKAKAHKEVNNEPE